MTDQPCRDCTHGVPAAADRCPHCGRPGLFPNVRAAEQPANQTALQTRYEAARGTADQHGALPAIGKFETALARSRAVLGRNALEVELLATSERRGYSTYYQDIEAGRRFADDNQWDSLRRLADTALFPGYEKHIRFLALSLDDGGLDSYGECFLVCKDSMIEHRASVLESNSTVFIGSQSTKAGELPSAADGYRATYENRAILCIAKLAERLPADPDANDFARILMTPGRSSADDEFVEVHVYGPMTIRTFQKIVIRDAKLRRNRRFIKPLRDRLESLDVELEVRR